MLVSAALRFSQLLKSQGKLCYGLDQFGEAFVGPTLELDQLTCQRWQGQKLISEHDAPYLTQPFWPFQQDAGEIFQVFNRECHWEHHELFTAMGKACESASSTELPYELKAAYKVAFSVHDTCTWPRNMLVSSNIRADALVVVGMGKATEHR